MKYANNHRAGRSFVCFNQNMLFSSLCPWNCVENVPLSLREETWMQLSWMQMKHKLTRPMSTGSGPLYSSITKNWFQSQLLRRRARGSTGGPPSSDSVTHLEGSCFLSGRASVTPVSKWSSGWRAWSSSELDTRLWALISPSTSPLVKLLLFSWFSASSGLGSDIRNLAAESGYLNMSFWLAVSALKSKLFGFLWCVKATFDGVLMSSCALWGGLCGSGKLTETLSLDSGWGKTCCGLLDITCESGSSPSSPAATDMPLLSAFQIRRKSRTTCAAIAKSIRSKSNW